MLILLLGISAGFIGTIAVTVSELLEMRVTGRRADTAPGYTAARIFGIHAPSLKLARRLSIMSHWSNGVLLGVVLSLLSLLDLGAVPLFVLFYAVICVADMIMGHRQSWINLGHRAVYVVVAVAVISLGLHLVPTRGDLPLAINWDLSRSHTMRDVDWPKPSIHAVEVRPLESVRIHFSGGHELRETSGMKKLALARDSDQVTEIGLHSANATVDEAYQLALRWCREWKLPTKKIDEWHAAAGKHYYDVAYDPKAVPAPGDPYVSLEVLYSFDDDLPVSIALNFFWATQPELQY